MRKETYRQIDLSHTVEEGLITYKGLPAPVICDFLSREASRVVYAECTEFQIGKIEMVSNTGTYVDSPFHRYAHGKDLSELPLASLADLDGVLVDLAGFKSRSISASDLVRTMGAHRDELAKALHGKAVLIRTDWSRHWRTDRYFEGHPFLSRDAAEFLVDHRVAIVGIDSYNIDDTGDLSRPAHTLLLGADVPIVEHLTNLQALVATQFRFFAVPVKVKAFGTFPVRAFALVQ